jgi:GTP-binding protein
MKFVDEVRIYVESGKGGSGCRSFRREKFVPFGGPDGGDGGKGGDVILAADRNKGTLLDFQFQPRWKAEDGDAGEGRKSSGRGGQDLIIPVPVGTEVLRINPEDPEAAPELVADLSTDGQQFVLAKGGRGGKGNHFFKSATNRVPEHFQPGEAGEAGQYLFSLKLVADLGLVGFPNAGKSTLISRISSAKPKIADYPFTTLTPNLGVVQGAGGYSFVVADIPGLIPGASEGKGLGIQFLKHIERTRLIAHLVNPMQVADDGSVLDPIESINLINTELKNFSEILANKPQIIVLTKCDTLDNEEIEDIKKTLEDQFPNTVFAISSVSGFGLEEFINKVTQTVRELALLET